METIGLFPLNIVLFPGSSYPLHIFEGRYRELIGESRASGKEFGIVLVEENRMFDIGCMARVSEVVTEYEDGRLDIVVAGTDRYRIGTYRAGEKSYLVADIEKVEDEDPRPEFELLDATISLYNQLVESVYGESEEWLNPSDWIGGGASFRMAQKSGLDLVVRQQLLEMRSETERLAFLRTYLTDLVPKVKALEKIQMLIRNDGYMR